MPTLETLKVYVFRNLTRRCYSIQAHVSGRWLTVAHACDVLISPATFKVSEAGRRRVLATGRKVLHAWVVGDLVAWAGEVAPGRNPLAWPDLTGARARPCEVVDLFDRAVVARSYLRETLRYRPKVAPTFTACLPGGEHLTGRSVTLARAVLMTPAGMVAGSAV